MSFERKLNLNKNIISFIFTSFFSLFIFFSNESVYVSKVESFFLDTYAYISYPKKWYQDIFTIKEENSLLSQKIVQLSLLNSELSNYKYENEKLKEMLEFKKSSNPLSLVPCNIVNNDYTIYTNSCIVNSGYDDGIESNLPVIDMYGNLIGKTVESSKKNTKVQLINDNNFSVSVKIRDGFLAQFNSTGDKFGELDGVLKTCKIKKGDIIYTSGISKIYPPDIPLAKVVDYSVDNKKMFQNVDVELLVDLRNLYYVFIIQ
ncbi:MAG: rod shape-determining protein MreC [Candidatus Marinimicrobia bacterium]|nr:rod shape-determining protein MreC [Candidatus Neomarinimicrobiota bacterium]|tara:strand:+ start:5438 stop:6217 length:780 start_codon:yes stop_codon:yes gene_type:complete